ncbi:MAG: type II toxin-antitoxin system VapC family toxin [Desulfobacterales bacterium]|nr:type II toxin-antitoxin system VapC family toxin [Desulfobacterales bacterium]
MNRIVLLDSGILGMVTNPKASREVKACKNWAESLFLKGTCMAIPEIADYEVRRELLRAGKTKGVRRLDELKNIFDYIPITTDTMLKASELWASVRKQGKPTADDKALDGDVILAAQAFLLFEQENKVIIATTNVMHLSLFADARLWHEI